MQQLRPRRSLLRRTAFVSRAGVGASGAGCHRFSTTTFNGNLDNWDPAVLDGLAKEREVAGGIS